MFLLKCFQLTHRLKRADFFFCLYFANIICQNEKQKLNFPLWLDFYFSFMRNPECSAYNVEYKNKHYIKKDLKLFHFPGKLQRAYMICKLLFILKIVTRKHWKVQPLCWQFVCYFQLVFYFLMYFYLFCLCYFCL